MTTDEVRTKADRIAVRQVFCELETDEELDAASRALGYAFENDHENMGKSLPLVWAPFERCTVEDLCNIVSNLTDDICEAFPGQ